MTENIPIDTKAVISQLDSDEVKRQEDQFNPLDGPPSYTEKEERGVRRRMDWIMLPVLCLLNLCSFLDKGNIGNANVAGMSTDLKLTTKEYQLLLTIFYIVYTLFQWEMILLRYIPPKIFLGSIVMIWGLASCLQGVCTSFGGLMACRVVIAVLEAGGGPACAFYLSLMYKRSELGFRWTVCQSVANLANSFAGAMAYGLAHAKTNLKPWKLVFVVESAPTFLSSILIFALLPSKPSRMIFLSKRQNEIALERVQRGVGVGEPKGYQKTHIIAMLKDPWTYLIALIHFGGGCAFNSLSVFLTEIVRDMGFSSVNAQGLVAPPWLFSYVVAMTAGWFSDKWSIRGYFIAGGQTIGAVGYLVVCFAPSTGARYFGTYLTCAGVYLAQPLMFSWCATNGSSDTKRAVSLVIFLITGQCGSILGSNVYSTGVRHVLGNSLCAGLLFFNVLLSLGGVYYLQWRNKKKDEQYGPADPDAIITPMDDGSDHPAWRFVM